jgi:phage-related protein
MPWTVAFVDDGVAAEMESQPQDIQARFKRMVLLIGEFGLQRLPPKYVSHLEGRLWELRMKGKDGIARALYVAASGQRVVIVRVFTKKTQKTPRREIELALKRAEEVT